MLCKRSRTATSQLVVLSAMLSAVSRKVRLSSLARSKSASTDAQSAEEDGEAFTDAAEVSPGDGSPRPTHECSLRPAALCTPTPTCLAAGAPAPRCTRRGRSGLHKPGAARGAARVRTSLLSARGDLRLPGFRVSRDAACQRPSTSFLLLCIPSCTYFFSGAWSLGSTTAGELPAQCPPLADPRLLPHQPAAGPSLR